jgi:hypothetical protein
VFDVFMEVAENSSTGKSFVFDRLCGVDVSEIGWTLLQLHTSAACIAQDKQVLVRHVFNRMLNRTHIVGGTV